MAGTSPAMTQIANAGDQTAVVIHCSSFCFGAAPTWREASWPSLKIIKVGIDITPYLVAVAGVSSTLSLRIFTLPFMAPEISSSAGAIMRQGPHHSAQKSTTTGSLDLSTSASKVASDTLPTAMGHLVQIAIVPSATGARGSGRERREGSPERQGAARLPWRQCGAIRVAIAFTGWR